MNRVSRISESCPRSPPGVQVHAAPDAPPASGAAPFRAPHVASGAPKAAPALAARAGAVLLDPHATILLRAIAAHDNCDNAAAVVTALVYYARAIGAGVLARAVLDARETHTLESDGDGGAGDAARPACTLEEGDLTDLPDFARSAAKRFRRCGT